MAADVAVVVMVVVAVAIIIGFWDVISPSATKQVQ